MSLNKVPSSQLTPGMAWGEAGKNMDIRSGRLEVEYWYYLDDLE